MYNPFSGWPVTGTWADHMSYSLGGIDYPLGYGTPLPAPAAGTLRISGGSGEFAAGEVGSAGRRSILMLDKPVLGLVAIVWQHQSVFGTAGHYEEGVTSGFSGASANGDDYGGDIHLHTHGLLENGARVDWRGYIALAGGSSVASSNKTPIVIDKPKESITMAEAYVQTESKQVVHFQPGVKAVFASIPEYEEWAGKVNFLIGRKVSDLLIVPPLKEVPGIDWDFYKLLCQHFNVPEK